MNTKAHKRPERRLAAILAADVAGYSRLMGVDEEGTHARLRAIRLEAVDPKIAEHRGRIFKTTGDGLLTEFQSIVDAVRCAVEVQQAMAERTAGVTPAERIEFRIGINLGDVIIEDGDIFGDGVNVAARLEALAEPGGICVSRVVRDQVRDRLDIAFDDLGEQQVKNIARPVRVFRVQATIARPAADVLGSRPSDNARGSGTEAEPQSLQSDRADRPPTLPDKPSIAVLPFDNMSGDPEQEYFVDGMVEEITTALSRIRSLFVVARNSSFTYKGQAVDVKQVGRELGVRYVLEGSVRKSGSRVRISAQLIDAIGGSHLWADHFDGSLEDVFDLQDKVASSVAGVIEPALEAAEAARSAGRPTGDLAAYELYLRASAMFVSSGRQIPEALSLLEQAIARDPRYGPALAWAAECCCRIHNDGLLEDLGALAEKGADFARRALEVAGDDPATLAHAAFALAYLGEDIGAMIALVDRALTLNPNYARGWHISGRLRYWAGQPDIAIEHVETALRLSPRVRVGPSFAAIGAAHFLARRFAEAAPRLHLAIQEDPSRPASYRYLAACYAHMGRLGEAREVIDRLRAIAPIQAPDIGFLRRAEDRELFLSGLRLAAGESA